MDWAAPTPAVRPCSAACCPPGMSATRCRVGRAMARSDRSYRRGWVSSWSRRRTTGTRRQRLSQGRGGGPPLPRHPPGVESPCSSRVRREASVRSGTSRSSCERLQATLRGAIPPVFRPLVSALFPKRPHVVARGRFPGIRQPLLRVALALGQSFQDVPQASPRVAVVAVSTVAHLEKHRGAVTAVAATPELPVLPPHADPPQVAFGVVVVDRQTALAQEPFQRVRVVPQIPDDPPEFALGQQPADRRNDCLSNALPRDAPNRAMEWEPLAPTVRPCSAALPPFG